MSLESAIQNLADAINAHAEATRFAAGIEGASAAVTALAAAADSEKKPRGRPAKASTEPAAAEAPPPPAAAVVAPTVTLAPAAPAAAVGATPSEADVKKALIGVVTKVGKEACTALCVEHGSPTGNFSGLAPSKYGEVIAAANALVSAAAAV